jgi:Bacterial regulatory protein, Fis family
MNSLLQTARMVALAFLYDRINDRPDWFRRLTPRQMEEIADVMVQWQLPNESNKILPMEEIERRELLRALVICQGNANKAAKALKIGKTTMYTKLRRWGYAVSGHLLLAQASVLSDGEKPTKPHSGKSVRLSPDQASSDSRDHL